MAKEPPPKEDETAIPPLPDFITPPPTRTPRPLPQPDPVGA